MIEGYFPLCCHLQPVHLKAFFHFQISWGMEEGELGAYTWHMTEHLNQVASHSCSYILLIPVSGKVVSTQRNQVEQIVDQFNIQVCFLSSWVGQLQYSCLNYVN